MSDLIVTKTRMRAGIWEGVVDWPGAENGQEPAIVVRQDGIVIRSVSMTPDGPDRWALRISIPPDLLSDGVQVFTISDAQDDAVLGNFAIVTGEALEDELQAEVALLRAELDMLKAAFRRHCLEN